MTEHTTAGRIVVADVWLDRWPGCENLTTLVDDALRDSAMTVVGGKVKDFKPQGRTAIWLLAESHMAMHTYPESQFIALDCYTCGSEGDPREIINRIIAQLPVKRIAMHDIRRGVTEGE